MTDEKALEQRRNKDRAKRYADRNPELAHDLRIALSDPGRFVKRGDNYREPLHLWQHRAVLSVLAP